MNFTPRFNQMPQLPSQALVSNRATWGVPDNRLPALGSVMHDLLPNESYDPRFVGQDISTDYFDSPRRELIRARRKSRHYLTLRLRQYSPPDGQPNAWALSAKCDLGKWRQQISAQEAHLIRTNQMPDWAETYLPANLLARLQGLVVDSANLVVCVNVRCRRYAVEDASQRFTLDVGLRTDLGKKYGCSVLEFKSVQEDAPVPSNLQRLSLRPLKLSKFRWATC